MLSAQRGRLAVALIAVALWAIGLPLSSLAAESVALPFAGGQSVRVIQGYTGGTHQGRSRFGLDLALAGGSSSGAEVLSPFDGRIVWAQAPGAGTGCLVISLRDGSFSVMMCHVLLNRGYREGETVARGQAIGTVGAPGTLENNGTSHVHLELHRGSQGNSPVPFGGDDGLALENVNMPSTGARGEYSAQVIVSTNGGGTPPAPPTATPTAAPPAPPTAAPTPVPTAAPTMAPTPPPAPVALPAHSGRTATVTGTESCLKVREDPSMDGAVVDCLPDGTEVALSAESRAGWRQVSGRGWVVGEYLRQSGGVVRGTDSCVNVRDMPSTAGRVVGCVSEGHSLAIVEGPVAGEPGSWLRVAANPEATEGGWVLADYVD